MNEEAVAREAIRDLVARYNSLGDSGRFELLLELFAPDAAMELRRRGEDDHRRHEGKGAIESIFTGVNDLVTGDGDAAAPLTFVRHLTATHVIDLVDADHATGRLYFQVLTDAGLDHWGRYVDRYRRIDGRWRFAERVVTTEGWAPGSPFLAHGEPRRHPVAVRVSIDHDRCTGHGRCYVLAPELFVDDDEGYGQVLGDGTVAPGQADAARKAAESCPERAVILEGS